MSPLPPPASRPPAVRPCSPLVTCVHRALPLHPTPGRTIVPPQPRPRGGACPRPAPGLALGPASAALLVQAFPEALSCACVEGRRSLPCSPRIGLPGGLSRLWAALGPAAASLCPSRGCVSHAPFPAVDAAPRGRGSCPLPSSLQPHVVPIVISCSARVTDEAAESGAPGHRSVCVSPACLLCPRRAGSSLCALTTRQGEVGAGASPWPAEGASSECKCQPC